MQDGTHNNAMAECALALAMAFFSIMVLTMVSMGAGTAPAALPLTGDRISIRPSAPSAAPTTRAVAGDTDQILVHYQGRFYDRKLAPIAPGAVRADVRTILAIDPALSLVDAIAVRQQIAHPNLIVTTLDARWLTALKELPK